MAGHGEVGEAGLDPSLQGQISHFPFKCRFSLEPLIRRLQNRRDQSGPIAMPLQETLAQLDQAPELRGVIKDPAVLKRHSGLFDRLMANLFAPLEWEREPLAAIAPFALRPVYASPKFSKLFLDAQKGMFLGRGMDPDILRVGRAIQAYLFILSELYGIHEELSYPIITTATDPKTGLERTFELRIDMDFVEVVAGNELPRLSQTDLEDIKNHLHDPEYLSKMLPPQDFEMRGVSVVRAEDITSQQVVASLAWDLIDQQSVISRDGFMRLQNRLRELFGCPDLVSSLVALQEDQVLMLNIGCQMEASCIFADSRHVPKAVFKDTVWAEASKSGQIKWVADLHDDPAMEKFKLFEEIHPLRSLMVAPLIYQNQTIGALDIASPRPGQFGAMEAITLSRVQPLFAMALKKALDDLDNQVDALIKAKCTAIHPVVEWRFRQAAKDAMERRHRGQPGDMETIVFKEVVPLYGVSDIRGSTQARNQAIQEDLRGHLELGRAVLGAAAKVSPLPILAEIDSRIGHYLERLSRGISSGDELALAEFLENEVRGIFSHLDGMGSQVDEAINAFEAARDPLSGSVFTRRRQFEHSVSTLNDRLAEYLDREQARIQDGCPHYYQRRRTDGVDYIIYAGDSLLEKGGFDGFCLKNLRLWQIVTACGLAWHSHDLQGSLPIPLDTAHLILVQDAPLNIRFRFDEKRFDVDGAYDIRHEIIRSRLDKAVVKGTGERLTQPGKVAVVYAQPEEGREIMRHLEFLAQRGCLTGEVERLELDGLPEVEGLAALRATVDLDSPELARACSLG